MSRIVVVGGGLTGLAAAHQLEASGFSGTIELWEADSRLGGVIRSEQIGGYCLEHSADMFSIDPPAALQLVRELGHEADLISTRPVVDRAWIAWNGQLHPVPRGLALLQPARLFPVLQTDLLTWEGKARMLSEQHVAADPERGGDDLSLASFSISRFGREAFERLIQPLAAGIYTADPSWLSMAATMERFREAVRVHGSLIAAGAAAGNGNEVASGARYTLFRAPAGGMQQLIEWLADSLTQTGIRTGVALHSARAVEGGWELTDNEGGLTRCDGVLSSVSPRRMADILGRSANPTFAGRLVELLEGIPAASSALAAVGIRREDLKRPFDGFGLIFPAVQQKPLIALSFSSNKFDGRAPEGHLLVRGFLGGALDPERINAPDEELVEAVLDGLREFFGYRGIPDWTRLIRWRDCMPQYHLGHLDRVAEVEHEVAEIPGLELAGNSYRGVGIPACIDSGRRAARRLLAKLGLDASSA